MDGRFSISDFRVGGNSFVKDSFVCFSLLILGVHSNDTLESRPKPSCPLSLLPQTYRFPPSQEE
eukprot:3875107-Amphidinium_carterae.1